MAKRKRKRMKRCPVGTVVQTVIFPKKRYTKKQAEAWLKKHKARSGIRRTRVAKEPPNSRAKYWHAPQRDPETLSLIRTITFGKGIKARIGCPKVAAKAALRRKKAPKRRRAGRRVAANPRIPGHRLYMIEKKNGRRTTYYATTSPSPFARGGHVRTREFPDPNKLINKLNGIAALRNRPLVFIREQTKKKNSLEFVSWDRVSQYWGMATS